ncbi:PqiC family protein [Nitrospira sp. Nam74]
MRPGVIRLLMSFICIGVLAACGSSPKVSYYTLGTARIDNNQVVPTGIGYTVAVGPVSLPEVVDRPELVTRVGANEVDLDGERRWAEPLGSAIPRVIAEHLTHSLGAQPLLAYPYSAIDTADYRVIVDIQRFDSEIRKGATIDAIWTIRRLSQKDAETKTGRSHIRETTVEDRYEALVAAHSRALAILSSDIAEAIRAAAAMPR